jgi:hypothetical protein
MKTPRTARSHATRDVPSSERLLLALGIDPALVEAVLGDLAEEYEMRATRDGPHEASRWYAREILRSAPHLALNAARRLDTRRRLLVLVGLAVAAAALSCVLLWRNTGVGPPARLVAGVRDTMVVNHVRPISLSTRVFDSANRPLPDTGVRYTWISGAPITISARGAIVCLQRGDAVVRAALGALATNVTLLCRPVDTVRTTIWNDFVLGDPARELPTEFTGVDGELVTLLSARIGVSDSTVATIDGLHIHPRRPGRTHLSLTVGDRGTGAAIRVFAPVRTLEGLRPAQRPHERFVAAALRLAPGESVRWPLPRGLFSLQFLPSRTADANQPAPTLTVEGPIMCLPAPSPRVYSTRCLARAPGATVTVKHPDQTTQTVVGALALEWERIKY